MALRNLRLWPCAAAALAWALAGSAGCGGRPVDAVELSPAWRSLVAHWTFDEGMGETAHDLSGQNRHGRLTGGRWVAVGRFGGALRIDRGDFVTVENFPDATPGWTVSVWLRLAPADLGTDWGTVLSTENISAGGWELHAATTGPSPHIDFGYFRDVPDTPHGYVSFECCPLVAERWMHVVAVVDPVAASATLYESGKAQTRVAVPGGILPGDSTLYMGRWNDGAPSQSRLFNGMIDEVAIYGRALTAAEVAALEPPAAAP